MAALEPRWAAETEVIRRLDAEWRAIADSWWLRRRLVAWAADDRRLAFEDGHRLGAAAQRRDVSSWVDRDRILAALLFRFEDDPVAGRVALQVVLAGVESLIHGLRGRDVEERAARVVATAVEVFAHCANEPAETPPSFRAYANTRRRALRAAIGDRSEPVAPVDDFSCFEDAAGPEAAGGDEERRLEELVGWVRQKGQLRGDVARLVVLPRAGGVSVDELAVVNEVHPQTMRQQRLRAEQRLRRNLSLARWTPLVEVRVASWLRHRPSGTAPGRARRFDERRTRREDSYGCCGVSPKR